MAAACASSPAAAAMSASATRTPLASRPPALTARVMTAPLEPEAAPMDVDEAQCASPPKRRPVVAVFDWDDTLCPTSWLHGRGALAAAGLVESDLDDQSAALSDAELGRLHVLEDHVLGLLHRAASLGPVFIVTAARLSWVTASAQLFFPRVHSLLARPVAGLQLVSAREWYHQHMSRQVQSRGDPLAWKTATFEALCGHLRVVDVARRLGEPTHLVSVGDATFEREACARMELRGRGCVRSKTLKLVEAPTLDELVDQLGMTLSLLDKMCSYDASVHLQVTRNAPPHGPAAPPLQLSQVSLGVNLAVPNPAASSELWPRVWRDPMSRQEAPLAPVPGVRS